MSAPMLTLGGLGERFARRPESIVDLADEIARRFAASDGGCIPASLGAAARDLLARCPDPSALPLWGVPYVIGANVDVEGLPTSVGLPALDFHPDFDAVIVERLRTAGALLVGKVSAGVLDIGGVPAEGGEAVATGLAAFCITAGKPAAAGGGVVSIMSARGRFSLEGVFAVAPELDGVVISAADVAGALVVRRTIENLVRCGSHGAPQSSRLGLLDGCALSSAQGHATRLAMATVVVDDGPFAEAAALTDDDVWLPLRLDDVTIAFAELPDLFPPRLRQRLARAFGRPTGELVRAQRRLATLCRQIEEAFSDFDLLIVPPEFGSTGFVSACGLAAVVLPDGSSLIGENRNDDRLAVAAQALIAPTLQRSTRPIDILASSPLAHR